MVKKNDRGIVKLTDKDLSQEACRALCNLGDRYTTINEIQEALDVLKAEGVGNADLEFDYDNYYGSSFSIRWTRDETDEEWATRVAKNKKIAAGQRKRRAEDKVKKELAERAELARLQEKYAGE